MTPDAFSINLSDDYTASGNLLSGCVTIQWAERQAVEVNVADSTPPLPHGRSDVLLGGPPESLYGHFLRPQHEPVMWPNGKW